MKIALIGHGKIGKLLEQRAKEKGYTISAIFDSITPLNSTCSKDKLANTDVCIDFSTPQCVIENIKFLASMKKNIVVGTTGWLDHLNEVTNIVDKTGIGLLHSPNFSIGISLFLKIVEQAAALITPFNEYDVAGLEIHHNKKIDRPSGTANTIANTINTYRTHDPIIFDSVRVGNVPGTHTVLFDSPADTISLTHTARNREGFVNGALIAAKWLHGKKGMFTMDDLLK